MTPGQPAEQQLLSRGTPESVALGGSVAGDVALGGVTPVGVAPGSIVGDDTLGGIAAEGSAMD